MNFLPATVRRTGDDAAAVLSDGQRLPVLASLPVADGDEVTIGLRPEHMRVAGDGGIAVRVEVVEPLGLSTQFYARLAGQQACVFAMGRVAVKPDDTVRLSVSAADLHVFNPKSGQRIG
jgi:multiple sugar transport system ATP-binding protein